MSEVGTIRRTALVAAVERAIAQQSKFYRFPPNDLRRVRRAARRMKRCLVGDWWSGTLGCGCPVGEAFRERFGGLTPVSLLLGIQLYDLGYAIDREIKSGRDLPDGYLRVRDR